MTGISVVVRIKPSDISEHSIIKLNERELELTCRSAIHHFTYNSVFDQNATERDIYESVGKPLLNEVSQGYNCTLLAYGQTSSGKTHTIFGGDHTRGIVPRLLDDILLLINQSKRDGSNVSIKMSYYEIYEEKIIDLLSNDSNKKYLKVGEDPKRGPYVKGLTYVNIENVSDAMSSFRSSYDRRSFCSTKMNERSSRAHSIFTLYLTITKAMKVDSKYVNDIKNCQFNLVDLAGSELYSDIDQKDVSKQRECIMINKSLFTLGKVITQLAKIQYKDVTYTPLNHSVATTPRKVSSHVSYRDSVLTWLLKESLGGNSKTTLIATVNSLPLHADETLRTLRYAQKANSIINAPTINEDDRCKMIKDLVREIERLKKELNHVNNTPNSPYQSSLNNLKRELDLRNGIIEQLVTQLKTSQNSRYSVQSFASSNTCSEDDFDKLRSGDFIESLKESFYDEKSCYYETPRQIRKTNNNDSPTSRLSTASSVSSFCFNKNNTAIHDNDDDVFVKPISPPPRFNKFEEPVKKYAENSTQTMVLEYTDSSTSPQRLILKDISSSPIPNKVNEEKENNEKRLIKEARISKNTNYAYKILYQDVCKKNIDLNEQNMIQEWDNKELVAKLTRCEKELNSSNKFIEQLESKIAIYQKLLEASSATREELLFQQQ